MGYAQKKQELILPSRQLVTPRRQRLNRAVLPGICPLPFVGRKAVIPGSASYTTPGVYAFVIPDHRTFVFDVHGAGGGGGGSTALDPNTLGTPSGGPGGPGGYSQVYYESNPGLLNVIGWGASGGAGKVWDSASANGSPGIAEGGDTNITGGGNGGGAGAYSISAIGVWADTGNTVTYAGTGGTGGRSVRTISQGLILPFGQRLIIVVGNGGAPGANASPNYDPWLQQGQAGPGAPGAVYIAWS